MNIIIDVDIGIYKERSSLRDMEQPKYIKTIAITSRVYNTPTLQIVKVDYRNPENNRPITLQRRGAPVNNVSLYTIEGLRIPYTSLASAAFELPVPPGAFVHIPLLAYLKYDNDRGHNHCLEAHSNAPVANDAANGEEDLSVGIMQVIQDGPNGLTDAITIIISSDGLEKG